MMKDEDWSTEQISIEIDNYLQDLQTRDAYIYKTSSTKYNFKKGDIKQKDIDKEIEKILAKT